MKGSTRKVLRGGALRHSVARSAGRYLVALPLVLSVALGARLGWAADAATGPTMSPPPSARSQAPWDPTGTWVSLVTLDWRFRMLVPGKGEYLGIPLNLKAKQFADAWQPGPDEAAGKQCEAYGGPNVLLVPERLNISWQDDNTLQVQTDAGMQNVLLHFAPPADMNDMAPSLQGYAAASWDVPAPPAGNPFGGPAAPQKPHFGSINVRVSHLLPGLIRKNGVPYGSGAEVTEYWEQHQGPTGAQYLIVSQILRDPEYLVDPYFTNATFEKEANGSQWSPTPCSLTSSP